MTTSTSLLRRSSLPAFLIAGLLTANVASAQTMTSNTVATWASASNVVSLAPGSSLSIATFKSTIESAFTAGTGGTISFDTVANGGAYNIVSSTFNSGNSTLTLTVTGGQTTNTFNTGTDATNASSASNYFGFVNASTSPYLFTPNQNLSTFGLVGISRGAIRNPVITLNLADSSTVVLTDSIAAATDNTLFNYQAANSSKNIVSFSIGIPDGLTRFDDFGFVVASAIPEPSTYAAIAGIGVLVIAAYRRRAIKKV